MATSLAALLVARLLLLASCVVRGPTTSQLALGIAMARGQVSGLPGAQLAALQEVLARLSDEYQRTMEPDASELTSASLWLVGSQQMRKRLAILQPISEVYDSGQPNETESDSCLSAVSRCQATHDCLAAQTTGVATGYRLTHRLLYAIVANKKRCAESKASEEQLLCAEVLREATTIARWGFPAKYQDLFTEQVALCGSLGHVEFLRADWFLQIIGWQLPAGCYAEQPGFPGHRTSVSAAALAVGVRFATAVKGFTD